jgi:hypothetical protein
MRRFRQLLDENEVIRILKNGKYGVLGVIGDDGYPYTVPLNYVYENGKIYFHGAKEGHKTDAIKECDKVSFCITDKDDIIKEKLTTYYKSVILFGRARILENDDEIIHAAEILGLKYSDDKKAIEDEIKLLKDKLCCVEITIEHITGKQALGLMNNK